MPATQAPAVTDAAIASPAWPPCTAAMMAVVLATAAPTNAHKTGRGAARVSSHGVAMAAARLASGAAMPITQPMRASGTPR
ncbi:hypothetical protein G6F35_017534 [Rhizopus arrhizus]|uniref:Uncharacterized protein n=1 Tax=Rhizopus delemar TaxID=936053 RepID=A0A9P7C185_9FUNG|nr:hypothetical protein G6F35_017534 [Rhizopus arrhizus]KAG1530970.1 hypothetical protein G6F50_016974 [Rhizopus delemar]